jgi:hypothetical protein
MRNWRQTFESLGEEQKHKLAVLRVMECTNGVIQYAFRDGSEKALPIEETRRAMKFSMGCMKKMQIPLGEEVLTFEDDLKEIFGEIRNLYLKGKTNEDDFAEFLQISIIMYNVLGADRILEAQEVLSQHITEIAPEHLQLGVDYIMQFIR